MATYILIPGAGGSGWYWHLLVGELRRRGHDAVAVDLPADDDAAGLSEYADAVVDAIGERTHLVMVAQSFGAFTAPLVCHRAQVDLLVLLNAMVPAPGESAGQWWTATGHAQARADDAARHGRPVSTDVNLLEDFFHDIPPELTAEAMGERASHQSATPFAQPWPLNRWPGVPTRFLQGRDDRFFPLEFQRQIAQERLGLRPEEMPGGHLLALSRPRELADRLEAGRTSGTPVAPRGSRHERDR
ncbi:MAG: alpha/beta fold hydrolase [Pseudonocardiaceae bacterium]